ncbi:hypothetical protein [Nonomuraea angiospora]|uniref:hypothetical protein n=1 Tax=Nonomuraea angiospora TaxID=46172 RepID=UPI0029A670B9|nr:hypothetical protein [Nonomuraea angiospora]MDX3109694.1 hypothetical protein [Nonomuraea angiospora]
MNGLTLAGLRKMASAASGRERRLTIVTGADGRRWAAWPYGCIELDHQQHGWLGRPKDGCYRMLSDGLARMTCAESFSPALVRREMLPLLAAPGRVGVVSTRWMYEDGLLMRRLLERSDGHTVVVDADFWRLWAVAVGGPVWQLGGRHGWLVWAPAEGEPGVAALGSVYAKFVPVPPRLPEAAA